MWPFAFSLSQGKTQVAHNERRCFTPSLPPSPTYLSSTHYASGTMLGSRPWGLSWGFRMELRSKKGGVHLITCGSALWLLWQERACTRETSVVGPLGRLGRMVGAEVRQMGPPWQTMARSLHCRALSRRYLDRLSSFETNTGCRVGG